MSALTVLDPDGSFPIKRAPQPRCASPELRGSFWPRHRPISFMTITRLGGRASIQNTRGDAGKTPVGGQRGRSSFSLQEPLWSGPSPTSYGSPARQTVSPVWSQSGPQCPSVPHPLLQASCSFGTFTSGHQVRGVCGSVPIW